MKHLLICEGYSIGGQTAIPFSMITSVSSKGITVFGRPDLVPFESFIQEVRVVELISYRDKDQLHAIIHRNYQTNARGEALELMKEATKFKQDCVDHDMCCIYHMVTTKLNKYLEE